MNPFEIKEVQELTKASNEVNNKTKAFENSSKEVKSPCHIPTINEGFGGANIPWYRCQHIENIHLCLMAKK